MIPKIIWQTHELPYDKLPDFQKKIIKNWKNLNPDWEHIYADAGQRSSDIKAFSKTLYSSYIDQPKITQADIWRYVMVYQYGGVYADMDSICTMPLDYFIKNNYNGEDMICTDPLTHINKDVTDNLSVNNSNFAAIKKSKVMFDVLEDVMFAYRIKLEGYYLRSEIPRKYMCWNSFANNVIRNKEKVCFGFNNSCLHDSELKEKFDDHIINYYGDKVNYLDLVKLNQWSLI